jgi:polysaccharide deacetylase family protein (PEP-CTERM system associated)
MTVTSKPVNALTIDVEDYFQVSAFSGTIERAQWDNLECRVDQNTNRLLDLLAKHSVNATFFTLGWVAKRYPSLVRRIVAEGHELASHGYGHQKVTEQTPVEFKADLLLAKGILEDISGNAIIGYRAPSFSIGAGNLWAHDILAATGHRYSSSVYPIKHDHYGMPDAPRFAFKTPSGLTELPATSIRLLNKNFPAAGGGFFRLLPYPVSKWSFQRVNELDGQSAIFYMHPWEVDVDQPRITDAPLKSKFRHYLNLHRVIPRLERLMTDFNWGRMDQIFAQQIQATSLPLRKED